MRIIDSSLIVLGLLATSGTYAQLSFGGHPYGADRSYALPVPPVHTMPLVDVAALEAEDEALEADGKKGPYRFGFKHTVDIGLENAGVWHTMSNGDRVWRTSILCSGALTINMQLDRFVVPDGAQLFVYNDMGDVLGSFEEGSNSGQTELPVGLLAGDHVTLEYIEPARVAGQGAIHVGYVTHGYRDLFGISRGLNASGSCNNNVVCPLGDPWRDQIRSVAIMVANGDGFCTGQLLNNCENDGTPYFLTANHCLTGGINNTLFLFNWQSPNCTTTTGGPTNQSRTGHTILHQAAGTDVALLRLNTTIPANFNAFFSGWDARAAASTGGAVAIHHPRGDVKKISIATQNVTSAVFGNPQAQCWQVPRWANGTTEPGSSGSGLWNMNGLLIGQLFGGIAACGNNESDFYGKFSVSYPALQEWLGDCGPTLQGYSPSVGIPETMESSTLHVWPNPGTGVFTLELPSLFVGPYAMRVLDMMGRVVLDERTTGPQGRLDLTSQPDGVYVVEVISGGHRIQQRLILAR